MSGVQLQRCLKDVLAQDDSVQEDWSQGDMKRLLNATSTLYRTSLNKVMLKSDEETVRGHVCALMACERLQEKQQAKGNADVVKYYMDRIPLEPKKVRHLVNVFKQNISQCSPVKNIQWSPSPKKPRGRGLLPPSPIKRTVSNNGFTSQDPKDLKKILFGSNNNTPLRPISSTDQSASNLSTPMKSPRRKLTFEIDDADNENDATYSDSAINGGNKRSFIESNEPTPEATNLSPIKTNEKETSNSPIRDSSTKKAKKGVSDYLIRKSAKYNKKLPYLERKFVKISPSEVINLCNEFEIPSAAARQLLDYFIYNATYLTHPWQLLCGLVLHTSFIVYHEKRRKDPRIDHHLVDRMASCMNCSSLDEIFNCYRIVEELIAGEKWFRNLQIQYNYFGGFNYQELTTIRLGSMLQKNSVLLSDEQYSNWKRRVLQDLSLRE